ncbi:MAG TPA: CoA transferase [Xanthobacteraceae bacterium]|nr:CoA transferase [Xanthobacteraceae bacterium]
MRPLAGIRVLDFSTLLPGPMATLLLAEAGAEVIKIERAAGEEMRRYHPLWGTDSVNFALLNRGKKSIAVDLKDADARDRVLALAEKCDVLVEQFRPGVMDRLGLGYAHLRARNPRIVYCAITGYGHTGPRRDRAGHDLNYIGDAGLAALSCGPPGQRVVPPGLIADIAGGAYPAVMNILLALRQRDATGEGAFLDLSMAENVFPFLYWAMGAGLATNAWPQNGAGLVTGGSPRYRLYDTRDGRIVAAAPLEQKFWEAFAKAIGLEPKFLDDARDPKATIARVAEIIASRDAAEWEPIFDAADCCCSIVQDVRAALADPHFSARGLFAHQLQNGDRGNMPALPVPISPDFRGAAEQPLPAPALGAHNAEFGF